MCVLSSANVHHAEDVLDYVYSNNIDDVSILPLYPDFSNCITDDVAFTSVKATVPSIWVGFEIKDKSTETIQTQSESKENEDWNEDLPF